MIITPSNNPGSNERHLFRRQNNPLFRQDKSDINQDTLMESQEKDHEMLLSFHRDFQNLIKSCVMLDGNEDTEKVLDIKSRLEKLFVVSSAIADDQSHTQEAIKKLIDTITQTIRNNIGNDSLALEELAQEERARNMHYNLLKSKLVADLLQENSVVSQDQLVATLLSTNTDELGLVLQIFDSAQLNAIISQGNQLLNVLDAEGIDVEPYAERLVFMEGYIEYLNNMDNIEPL